jgi:predicted nucleic acid-binding protein
MKYVVDASVALKWVLPEAHSDQALRLRDDFQKRLHELLAPDIFPVELAHALTRAERKKIIPVGYAKGFLAGIMQVPPVLYPSLALLSKAADISSRSRLGVYDCLYVALAGREQCELVTADERLVNALHEQFPFIVLLSALP